MLNSRMTYFSLAMLLTLPLLTGCEKPPATPTQTRTDRTNEPNHDHTDHDHDRHHVEGHAHSAGPHGGAIADWGGGTYHVEFTVDHDKKQATVYVLGGDEKTPAPIAAESILLTISQPELQIDLLPVPQVGDPTGKSSCFAGTHDSLATVTEYAGTLSALVDGVPYAGKFQEETHNHEAASAE